MEIPRQLQNENYRFNLLNEKEKNPVKGVFWSKDNYKYNDEVLLNHLKNNKNYGVIGGHGNLRIIDIDDKKLGDELIKNIEGGNLWGIGNVKNVVLNFLKRKWK